MSQWAVNPNLYGPRSVVNGAHSYDISFVGEKYGNRGPYIRTLERSGLTVVAFGRGFQAGHIQFEEMLRTFSQSRINLNFSGTPALGARNALKALVKLVIKKELGRYKFSAHGIKDELRSMVGARRPQIKSRIFEVPACAGFLMTTAADGLDEYYTPNREIVIFENAEDLVEKCRYYLAHEGERYAIAEAGARRTLLEHTYAHRFREIFQRMGLIDKLKDTNSQCAE
jgi:spore maturation protein CgeB